MTPEEVAEIKAKLGKTPSPPATPLTPKEVKYTSNQKKIDDMETEIRLLELQKRKKDLEKDDTTFNTYFAKLMEFQAKNHELQIEQLKSNMKLQVELEKLKLESMYGSEEGEFETIAKMLIPFLGQQEKTQHLYIQQSPYGPLNKDGFADIPNQGQNFLSLTGSNPSDPDAKIQDKEKYLRDVREGKITFDEFYEDFQQDYPEQAKIISKKKLKAEFDRVKGGGELRI